MERLLLHGCCEVISSIVQYAVSDNREDFTSPNCSLRVSIGVQCPVNWGLKALIGAIGMKATPVKRKRTNGLFEDPQALYDVDVGEDIIVRCHRKIVYPNGTIADSIQICPRHPRLEELC